MADTVFRAVQAAYAAGQVQHVFPMLERIIDAELSAPAGGAGVAGPPAQLEVTVRFGADDGGRFLLKLCGDHPATVDMALVVSDGGLPTGFVDDINPLCFELDFAGSALDKALTALLTRAAALYMKMNRTAFQPEEEEDPDWSSAFVGGDSGAGAGAGACADADTGAGATDDTAPADRSNRQEGSSVGDVAAAQAIASFGDLGRETLPYSYHHRRDVAYPRPAVFKPPDFAPSHLASTTLTKQLQLLGKLDTISMGFSIHPLEDNLYIWRVKLYFTDMSTTLAQDLAMHPTHNDVELEFRFPTLYPCTPPFCRVVAPAFLRGTGYVQPHGGLCMELLTGAGWTPANSMDAVCIQIHSFLVSGHGRLDLAHVERSLNYTYDGAMRDLSAVVNAHGWDVSNSRPAKSRKRTRDEKDELGEHLQVE
jgi:ubiquitin-protein ligase